MHVWGCSICSAKWNTLSITSADIPSIRPKMKGNWKCASEEKCMQMENGLGPTVGDHVNGKMTKEIPWDSIYSPWLIPKHTTRYQMAPTAMFAFNIRTDKETLLSDGYVLIIFILIIVYKIVLIFITESSSSLITAGIFLPILDRYVL